jgi:SAM-dependent methyltransferase
MPKRVIRRNPKKYVFTEEIDYSVTGKTPIWGKGDKKTSQFLARAKLKGNWVNLAAGDGRYSATLLKKVDSLLVVDIDRSALEKLWRTTPPAYRRKLKRKVADITKKLPFQSESFEGALCTGVLYAFPPRVFVNIAQEMDRILKPGGTIIVDFATDIRRKRLDNGKPYIIPRDPHYTADTAKKILKKAFPSYDLKMWKDRIPLELYPDTNPPYSYKSNYILLVARKRVELGCISDTVTRAAIQVLTSSHTPH